MSPESIKIPHYEDHNRSTIQKESSFHRRYEPSFHKENVGYTGIKKTISNQLNFKSLKIEINLTLFYC